MKRFTLLFLLIILLFSSCENSAEKAVAHVYNEKLYLSEIKKLLPEGLTPEDSAKMVSMIIDDWIFNQIIIHEANKLLPAKSKNFEKEISDLKKKLLLNAYYQYITSDSALFQVSDKELQSFISGYQSFDAEQREIIKLNYVKLSKNSKLIKEIKGILFDDVKRVTEKPLIEKLCADSIEYFIDDDSWLYLDDIKKEFPADVFKSEASVLEKKQIEISDKTHTYIIVFIDYKTKRAPIESQEEIEAARAMLIQAKKTDYIMKQKEALYKKAVKEEKVIR